MTYKDKDEGKCVVSVLWWARRVIQKLSLRWGVGSLYYYRKAGKGEKKC